MFAWFQGKGLLYFVRLAAMAVLTGFNFWLAVIRWGFLSADPIIKSGALILSAATEIALFAALVLFHLEFYATRKRSTWLLGWGIGALACISVSLYVNVGYFVTHWQDAGGNTATDLAIRALFPMGLLLLFSMIPPKHLRSIADIQSEHQVKAAEIKSKLDLEQLAQSSKMQRRQQVEEIKAKRVNMRRIAGAELFAHFTSIDEDENEEIDWLGLEKELMLRGQLSQSGDSQPSIEAMIKTAKTESAASIIRPSIKRRGQAAKSRIRRTSAEIAAITDAYLRGEYTPRSRQERYQLMKRAGVNKSA